MALCRAIGMNNVFHYVHDVNVYLPRDKSMDCAATGTAVEEVPILNGAIDIVLVFIIWCCVCFFVIIWIGVLTFACFKF